MVEEPEASIAAVRFIKTREAHRTESAEDYVEMIRALADEEGRARVGRLAARLGVSPVTVSKALRRLERDGLVLAPKYGEIELTAEGGRVAEQARLRHDTVVRFLLSLGVPQDVAESDAEGIEHHVSPLTLEAMRRSLEDRCP